MNWIMKLRSRLHINRQQKNEKGFWRETNLHDSQSRGNLMKAKRDPGKHCLLLVVTLGGFVKKLGSGVSDHRKLRLFCRI